MFCGACQRVVMAIFPRAGRAQLKDGKIIPRKREYKTYEQSQIVRHIKQQGHQLNASKLNPTESSCHFSIVILRLNYKNFEYVICMGLCIGGIVDGAFLINYVQ